MKRTVAVRSSDLSGAKFTASTGQTVRFGYRGDLYEIDLTNDEMAELDGGVALLVEHARHLGRDRGRTGLRGGGARG